MEQRAEIVDTGSRWAKAARITVHAPAAEIFDLLADPRRHPDFDGSGTLRGSVSGPERLSLGARFGMDMHLGVPYRIGNEVVEFEEGRRIAWCHFYKHRWRYELEPVDDATTVVTETFDARTALFPPGSTCSTRTRRTRRRSPRRSCACATSSRADAHLLVTGVTVGEE